MRAIKYIILSSFFISNIIFSLNIYAKDYLDDARQSMSEGKYKAAIIQLKNQIKQKPYDSEARYLLGTLYLQDGQLKQADKELSKAYELVPNNSKFALAYAEILLTQKKYLKFDEVLDVKFNDPEEKLQSRVFKAYALLGQNKLQEARQAFSELAAESENIAAYTGLGKIAFIEKKPEKAMQWVNKALALDNNDSETLQLKAKIEFSKGNLEQALSIYTNLIKSEKNNLPFYLERVIVRMNQQDIQGAEQDVRKVLAQVRNNPSANFLLSRIQLQKKEFKAAEMSAQKVLNISPRFYSAMLVLGVSHYAQKNFNQADKYLTQYLSINSSDVMAKNLLANVYLAQGKALQAVLILEGTDEEKNNYDARTLETLGTAYLLTGEFQKGVDALSRAKTLAPDNRMIQQKLIRGQIKTGDIKSAITGLEQIVESDKNTPKLNYLLIVSYISQKEFNKAEEKLKEFIKDTPDDPALYNLMAVLEKTQGNIKKAIGIYNQALKINIKFIPAYVGLAEIALQQRDFKTAKTFYAKIIQIDPRYTKAYLFLANIAAIQGDNAEVDAQLLEALQQSEGDINQQLSISKFLINWYLKQKTPEKLMPVAQKLIDAYPEHELALSFLAAAQAANNQNEQAEQTLRKIIKQNESNVEQRLNLASLLEKKKGMELEVLELFDAAIAIAPDNTKPVIMKSAYLLRNKQFNKMLELGDYAEKQFPKLALGASIKGDTYRLENKPKEALINYYKAYKRQPTQKVLFLIADTLSYLGKEDDAIKLLESKLNGDNRNDLKILLKMVNFYQKRKEYDTAIQYYKKILAIDPKNLLAMNNLAWAYVQKNDPQALVWARKAYDSTSDSAAIVDTYAYVQLKQGNIKQAVTLFRQAVKLAPEDSGIKYNLAKAYHLNGENKKARQLLETILKNNMKPVDKEKALKLLKKISA